MQFTVLYNQTLADLSVQATGDLNKWFDCALLAGLGITDEIAAGQIIELPEAEGSKGALSIRLQANDNRPATGDLLEIPVPTGIDYMQIGNDFIVR